MKKLWVVLGAIVVLVANFSVNVGYSLKIEAFDTSLKNEPTFFTPENGERIRIRNGETLILESKVSGMVVTRSEIGWLEIPVKSRSHIKVSIKKAEAAKAEPVMLFVLAAIQRRNSSLNLLTAEIPVMFPGQFPATYKNNVK